MKILILGARGMLGQDLAKVFFDKKPILWDIDELDIANKEQVFKKISEIQPKIVINSAAYTEVDGAETDRESALKINAEAVGYLAETCQKIKAIFIHYSTDYVFDGEKKQGYTEDEQPEKSVNFYGYSKFLGEQKILSLKSKVRDLKFYLIRTSWLFGPSGTDPKQGKSFISQILKISQEKSPPKADPSLVEEIKVVNDQFGKSTYTLDLAQTTKKLIEKKYPSGIYHLVNEGAASRYQVAQKIIELVGLKTKVIPCSSQEFPRPAKRPKYGILVNTKFPQLRNWQEALKDYIITNHTNFNTNHY